MNLTIEGCGTVAGLAFVGIVATGIVHDHQDLRRLEARSAATETAQNLLAMVRAGDTPALPPGWTLEREATGPGCVLVRVRGQGVTLVTVVKGAP